MPTSTLTLTGAGSEPGSSSEVGVVVSWVGVSCNRLRIPVDMKAAWWMPSLRGESCSSFGVDENESAGELPVPGESVVV